MSYDNEQPRLGEVYAALNRVKKHIAKEGVTKDGHNKKQGYDYRGIDGVMDAFASPLAENDLLAAPVYADMQRYEHGTKGGTAMVIVTVSLTLTFVSLKDGSTFTVGPFWGEGSDVLDKATSKAHSVAYRNAMLLTFTSPLGPEMDPEASEAGHEIAGDGDTESTSPEEERPRKIEGLTGQQSKALQSRLKAVKMTEQQLLERFGGVGPDNFKAAMMSLRSAE